MDVRYSHGINLLDVPSSVSKLEYCLWGADFMIGGIGWFFGGPYAGLACSVLGAPDGGVQCFLTL